MSKLKTILGFVITAFIVIVTALAFISQNFGASAELTDQGKIQAKINEQIRQLSAQKAEELIKISQYKPVVDSAQVKINLIDKSLEDIITHKPQETPKDKQVFPIDPNNL